MLLHKFYINVAIANILLCSKSLYDLPRRNCKNTKNWRGHGQKGRGSEKCPNDDNVYPSKFCYLGPKEEIHVEKSWLASHVSGIVAIYRITMGIG